MFTSNCSQSSKSNTLITVSSSFDDVEDVRAAFYTCTMIASMRRETIDRNIEMNAQKCLNELGKRSSKVHRSG